MRKTWLMVPLIVVGLLANTGFAQETKRALTKITGDVYRFQNNFHFSVVTVTGNGVVVTDPINAEAAAIAEVSADPRVELEALYGKLWDTTEMGADFSVSGFMAPYVIVQRKSDGVKGSLLFQNSPRLYHSFSPE